MKCRDAKLVACHPKSLPWLVTALVVGACTGEIAGRSSGGSDPGRPSDQDDQTGEPDPIADEVMLGDPQSALGTFELPACREETLSKDLPLRRLSRRQFTNNLKAAIELLVPGRAEAILQSVAKRFEDHPHDAAVSPNSFGAFGFTRADQIMSQQQADNHFAIATDLATALASQAAHLEAVFGGCATDSDRGNDVTCAATGIQRWGSRLLRMPLGENDIGFFAQAAAADRGGNKESEGFADVLTLMLSSPSFFFHVEGGAADPKDAKSRLQAHELASRLAFNLTDAPPDAELWAAAASGEILNDGVYKDHVMRLVSSEAAVATRDVFFDEWFGLSGHTPNLLDKVSTSKAWAELTKTMRPQANSHGAMIDDVLMMARAEATANAPVNNLLTNRNAYARDAWLAGLYEVNPWDGGSVVPHPAAPARSGLLTRPAFTASGDVDTRPIQKGTRIRNALLCDHVPSPPPGAAQPIPPPDRENPQTTRQLVAALTEQPSTPCRSCHMELINPLGFMTENFDGLGRERNKESVFLPDGEFLADVDIDTETVFGENAAALQSQMVESGKFSVCFARQLFRFSSSKAQEVDADDGCVLRGMMDRSLNGDGILDVMAAYALSENFKRRLFN